jgi:hypothetical protein
VINSALSTTATCEAAYATWTATGADGMYGQQGCRSYHLCNAAASVTNESAHCPHAQGYNDSMASTMYGTGPCP